MSQHLGTISRVNAAVELHLEKHHARQLIEDLQLPHPDTLILAGADDDLMLAGASAAPELD